MSDRLKAMEEFTDRLFDEGFPNDPYLSGRLRSEMERLGYACLDGHSWRTEGDGEYEGFYDACEDCGARR